MPTGLYKINDSVLQKFDFKNTYDTNLQNQFTVNCKSTNMRSKHIRWVTVDCKHIYL